VFVFVALSFIMVRFRWQAAVATLVAVIHDVVIAAGLYALFGFEVTAPTAAAILAVTAYSLYDKAVMLDRVRENERRMVAAGRGAADVVNVSANQSLMRWLVTSISLMLAVIALLVAGLFGEPALRNLGIGLLIGLVLAVYSTVSVALPLLAMLRRAGSQGDHFVGEDLRTVVVRGVGVLTPLTSRRRPGARPVAARRTTLTTDRSETAPGADQTTEQLLGRAPRPRKKKRH
jgi:preprotein translocase subunit SecF